ncbi:MAG TPA: helix-turn-helix domain-containing protein [Blastocatellia bacterium]|nr:helix-turn-helix domain-containing protein [Blastocatellia bacterium]
MIIATEALRGHVLNRPNGLGPVRYVRGWAVSLVGREYASVKEAAEVAGVSESTVRRWARAGRVSYESYFGRIVVLRGDLEWARANSRAVHKRG